MNFCEECGDEFSRADLGHPSIYRPSFYKENFKYFASDVSECCVCNKYGYVSYYTNASFEVLDSWIISELRANKKKLLRSRSIKIILE